MSAFEALNFPRYLFRVRTGDRPPKIWDDIRRQWLVLTPEEWVRRHLVRYLVEEKGVLPACVSQEYPVALGGMAQRADVAVTGRDGRVCLLVECKAPDVPLDEKVWAQAVRYNSVVGAPYLAITNGLQHFCCSLGSSSRYTVMDGFPDLSPFFRIQ